MSDDGAQGGTIPPMAEEQVGVDSPTGDTKSPELVSEESVTVDDDGKTNESVNEDNENDEVSVSVDDSVAVESEVVPKKSKNQLKRERRRALRGQQKEQWKERKRQKKLEREQQEMEELQVR
ncbi:uncharacterized protein [Panulirus ornatus]|uniref:uncharacterized protein n=1 Tax=Panulirus ornatus TaxID=150431 RepID=UPI003A8B92F6